jgi:L-threonylcarbamoyladenylate synthase
VGTDAVEHAIAAAAVGRPILLPTDTVYGLATSAERADFAAKLYLLKGRSEIQPTAIVAGSIDALVDAVPELDNRSRAIAAALLPGPFTLVLPNPAQRFRWLTGARTDTIGVRVPNLPEPAQRVADGVGCLIATSANDPGGPDPASLDDVPQRIRDAVAAEIDAGALPGIASTVIDFTTDTPVVLREGAVPGVEAIERVRAVLAT